MRMLAIAALAGVVALGACGKDDKAKSNRKDTPKKEPPKVKVPQDKPPEPKPDPALIARGAYVAQLGGCVICHTGMTEQGPDVAKAFAGGLVVTEPYGTWRSPNITPDKKTGIGDWTDEQIMAAIRQGVRPDGTKLYPIMPYMYFSQIADDDAKALVAFLRSLPPIENAVQGSDELKMPQPPAPPALTDMPDKSDPAKYGAYLANIMHCHVCHTPMTDKGPDMAKSFAGGDPMPMPPEFQAMGTGDLIAPNITPDEKTGIGKWTEEQIVAAFTQAKRPDGKPIFGPMMFYAMGWKDMPAEDAKAVAAFLKSLPPTKNKVAKSTFKPAGPPPGAPK